MIWSIAWRNVWRNKLRSLVVILAITLGLFGTLFLAAFTNGMVEQKIDSAINNELSHIQIHNKEFMQEQTAKFYFTDAKKKTEAIRQLAEVKAACSRLKTTAMVSTAANGTGVNINGIQPEDEMQVTKIHEALTEGDYFEKESRNSLMLISEKLASNLKAKPGSKIVVTIQDMNGELVYGLFRVAGIFKSGNGMFDELNVFVKSSDLADLIGFDNKNATEIAVLLQNADQTNKITNILKAEFSDLNVMSWKEISPLLLALSSMMDQFSYILLVIILIAMAFGIINTMLMAILERVREIGMLMAVGMNRRRIFMMIMLETIFLSLTGGLLGMLISLVTIKLTGINGINFSSWAEGMEAMGYPSLVYPSLYSSFYITLTIMVIFTGILSSIYPARKALKFKPAEAVRADT